MAKKKVKGVGIRKGNILLDEVDLNVLKILNKNKEDLSIGDVQEMIRMSHVSFKIHVRRLIELKFITSNRIPKTFKHILKITNEGRNVLTIFERVLK